MNRIVNYLTLFSTSHYQEFVEIGAKELKAIKESRKRAIAKLSSSIHEKRRRSLKKLKIKLFLAG